MDWIDGSPLWPLHHTIKTRKRGLVTPEPSVTAWSRGPSEDWVRAAHGRTHQLHSVSWPWNDTTAASPFMELPPYIYIYIYIYTYIYIYVYTSCDTKKVDLRRMCDQSTLVDVATSPFAPQRIALIDVGEYHRIICLDKSTFLDMGM